MPDSSFAETLVAGLSEALIHVDAEGRIQVWNGGAERIFGFMAAEVLGRTLDLIIPASLRERHNDGFAATMRTGHTEYGNGEILAVPALRKDGTRISVAFSIVPFTDTAGRMTGIAAVMRDVTAGFEELRALRREVAALRAGQR
jgi:PAS domain S-box-containing protein